MKEKPSSLKGPKWLLYDVKVKLAGLTRKKKKQKIYNKKLGQNLFLFFFLLFPVAQFLIFYVGVAANTMKLAFQKYDGENGAYYFSMQTFAEVFRAFFVSGEMSLLIKNSAIQFLCGLLIGMPLQIMVAYVVFKEVPGSGAFKVILFLPNIISSLVFVMCARTLIQKGLPVLFNNPDLLLLNRAKSSSFYTVLIFGMWMNLQHFERRSGIRRAGKHVVVAGIVARGSAVHFSDGGYVHYRGDCRVLHELRAFLFVLRRRGRGDAAFFHAGVLFLRESGGRKKYHSVCGRLSVCFGCGNFVYRDCGARNLAYQASA